MSIVIIYLFSVLKTILVIVGMIVGHRQAVSTCADHTVTPTSGFVINCSKFEILCFDNFI